MTSSGVRLALWTVAGALLAAAVVWLGMCVVTDVYSATGGTCGSAFHNRAGAWRHLGGEPITQAEWDVSDCRLAAVARFHAAYRWSALAAVGGAVAGLAVGLLRDVSRRHFAARASV